jgi:hypothetical protein
MGGSVEGQLGLLTQVSDESLKRGSILHRVLLLTLVVMLLNMARRSILVELGAFGTYRGNFREADILFKDYFSKRLTLQPHDYQQFLSKVCQKHFNE